MVYSPGLGAVPRDRSGGRAGPPPAQASQNGRTAAGAQPRVAAVPELLSTCELAGTTRDRAAVPGDRAPPSWRCYAELAPDSLVAFSTHECLFSH